MKHLINILGISSIIFFIACTDKKQVNNEFGELPNQVIDSLVALGSSKQIQTIKTDKPNTIVGKEGTVLLIPKNAITDEKGIPYTDSITIELKENFTVGDFILSNLQTVQDDGILVSNGMVYFNAKDKYGNQLNIANNVSIRIQIPQKDDKDNPKVFLGERDELGHITWSSTIEPSKTLIPYPIRFISKNRFWTECPNYYGITKDTLNHKKYNHFGNIEEYENSLIATKEFHDRFSMTCWDSVLNIYISNLDKNMWEIDEMVVKYFIRDSIRYLNSWYCEPPTGVNGKPVTVEQKEAYKWIIKHAKENEHWRIELYRNFAKQKLMKVDTTKLIDTTKLADINSVFTSYDALKFGWVNVDYFYKDPRSEKVKVIAKTNEQASIISMIIKGKNVILSGIEKGTTEYWFTKNQDGYNKLPKGEKAIIIAISVKNNELFFGDKEFIIGEKEIQQIDLKPIKGKDLMEKLAKYNN
jgi:hypothetical protein